MTKKHYELIAMAIYNSYSNLIMPADDGTIEHIVEGLAIAFEKDNPRFDKDKFIKACGIER